WMLLPVLASWVQMLGWAVLALLAASLLHVFDPLPVGAATSQRLGKGLGCLLAIAGILQIVGVASGGRDPLQPLAHLASQRAPASIAPSSSPDAFAGFTPAPPAGFSSTSSTSTWSLPTAQVGQPEFMRVSSL